MVFVLPKTGKKALFFGSVWKTNITFCTPFGYAKLQNSGKLAARKSAFFFYNFYGLLNTRNRHMRPLGNFGVAELKGGKTGNNAILIRQFGNDLTSADLAAELRPAIIIYLMQFKVKRFFKIR